MAWKPRGQGYPQQWYPQQLGDAIQSLLPAELFHDLPVHGNTQWVPLKLLTAAALMSWLEARLLTNRFEQTRELLELIFPGEEPPRSYTGYAEALVRWRPRLWDRVREQLQGAVQRIAVAAGHWTIGEWIPFGGDGSRFNSPRTRANEQELKCAGKVRTAPQVFQTTLLHLGTNALWDFRLGPGIASEREQLQEMARQLPPGSLLVADAGVIGYELCQRLNAAGVSFLLRVGGNVTLLTEQLGAPLIARMERTGQRVWLWPWQFHGRPGSPPLELRLLRVRRQGKSIYLVTNVLEPTRLTRQAASEIYRRRWDIEVAYRTIKQTFQHPSWLSRTPRTVLAEQWAVILGLWILQILSLQELTRKHIDPKRFCPARARNTTRRVMRHALRDPPPGTQSHRTPRPPSPSSQHRPSTPSWREQLGQCERDRYTRKRPKHRPDWPHKKRNPPIEPPWICLISPQLLHKGKQLLQQFTSNTS